MPDITVYIEALQERLDGRRLIGIELSSPFLLRTVEPPPASLHNQRVKSLDRLGKRIAFGFENDHWLVLHLMIAGRLHWFADNAKPRRSRQTLALFQFESGTLTLTEAGTKKRAAMYVVSSVKELNEFTPTGLEPLKVDRSAFAERLRSENHTLKRSLTDQRLFSGIGNAYSDEILHEAGLSPLAMSQRLDDDAVDRLYQATQSVLREWIRLLRIDRAEGFPEKVTAFRDGMAVHGRYGEPCPKCSAPVQRIRYASKETNYCAACQTGGRILADRALSRLLKKDFPRHLEDLE